MDGIVRLERVASRGANPTCLHLEFEKDVREFLFEGQGTSCPSLLEEDRIVR
jgi:hypothetical protein